MADPAAQSFRDDAERHSEILGSETDRVEAAIFADLLSEEWVLGVGDVDTPSLTDLKAGNCPVCAVQKVGGLGDDDEPR